MITLRISAYDYFEESGVNELVEMVVIKVEEENAYQQLVDNEGFSANVVALLAGTFGEFIMLKIERVE